MRDDPSLARELLHTTTRPIVTRGYHYQLLATAGWTSLPLLPLLRQPTLILAGDDDPIIPQLNARILHRLIPRSEPSIYHGGHLDLVTQAGHLAPLVEAFLGAQTQPATRTGRTARQIARHDQMTARPRRPQPGPGRVPPRRPAQVHATRTRPSQTASIHRPPRAAISRLTPTRSAPRSPCRLCGLRARIILFPWAVARAGLPIIELARPLLRDWLPGRPWGRLAPGPDHWQASCGPGGESSVQVGGVD